MQWKGRKIVGVISILLIINISVYGLTKADTNKSITEQTTPVVLQKSHSDKILQKALVLCDKYKEEGLTLPILMGIIEVESNFNPKAISKDIPTSYGLMQVLRSTATPIMKELGYKWSLPNILNPDVNMEVGVEYLMSLHRSFVASGIEGKNEFHVTLIAYNRGETSVRAALKSGSLKYLGKIKVASRKWE